MLRVPLQHQERVLRHLQQQQQQHATLPSTRQIADLVAEELLADLAAKRIEKIDYAVIRDRLAAQDGRRVRHSFNALTDEVEALIAAVAKRVVEVGP